MTTFFNSWYKITREKLNQCHIIIKNFIACMISRYLIEIHNDHYIIHYPYNTKWYKIIVKRDRGPQMIDSIHNDSGLEITDEMSEYMGPYFNAHTRIAVTPQILGYKQVKIINYDGDEKVFSDNDIISC